MEIVPIETPKEESAIFKSIVKNITRSPRFFGIFFDPDDERWKQFHFNVTQETMCYWVDILKHTFQKCEELAEDEYGEGA